MFRLNLSLITFRCEVCSTSFGYNEQLCTHSGKDDKHVKVVTSVDLFIYIDRHA